MRTANSKKTIIKPMRLIVSRMRLSPRTSLAEDSPLIRLWGGITLTTDPAKVKTDLHFKAEIQVYPDYTFDVLSFTPLYGSIEGVAKQALNPYKDAFESVLKDTKLKFLRVT